MTEKDRNFITDSWVKSYRNSPECKYMLTSVYKSVYWDHVTKELKTSQVDIERCDGSNLIKGYCVYENIRLEHCSEKHSGDKTVVKYLYTTFNHRNKGVASNFLNTYSMSGFVYTSYINADFVLLCKKLGLKHVHLPYLKAV